VPTSSTGHDVVEIDVGGQLVSVPKGGLYERYG
jgi:hypothetical protein